MSTMVICVKCGHGNTFGHVFCVKCGAKLDLENITASNVQSDPQRVLTILSLVVRSGIVLVLVLLLAAILLPAAPRGARGTDADLRRYREKRAELDRSLLEGQAATVEFTEGEINAYLAATLQRAVSNETVAAWQLQAADYQVVLADQSVTVLCAARLGPLRMTYEITGAPRTGPFGLNIRSGRWGRLPLPGPAAQWMGARLGELFHRWQKERTLLNHAAGVEAQAGRVVVALRKQPASE